jgi:hypothetical protein
MTTIGAARLTAFAIALLGGVLLIGAGWTPTVQPDADAYWHAALRLRDGMPLYLPAGPDETEIYRYAPWFAYAWVPLTYLGQGVAYAVWRLVLFGAACVAVVPLLRRTTPAGMTLAVIIWCLLVSNLPAANVTTLMVGVLAIGLPRRSGPVLLGVAGSLKLFPLLLVAGYLAERRWRDAAMAIGTAGLLWLPLLLFDLGSYPTTTLAGSSFYLGGVSLYSLHPLAAAGAALLLTLIGILLIWRRSPWTWLLAGAAIPAAVPRVWLPDTAWVIAPIAMLAGAGRAREAASGSSTAASTDSPARSPVPVDRAM